MRIASYAAAAALALLSAVPALADAPAAEAGQQVKLLIGHDAALRADLLQVEIQGQTIYVRGAVDSRLESARIDQLIETVAGPRIVNATAIVDSGS